MTKIPSGGPKIPIEKLVSNKQDRGVKNLDLDIAPPSPGSKSVNHDGIGYPSEAAYKAAPKSIKDYAAWLKESTKSIHGDARVTVGIEIENGKYQIRISAYSEGESVMRDLDTCSAEDIGKNLMIKAQAKFEWLGPGDSRLVINTDVAAK